MFEIQVCFNCKCDICQKPSSIKIKIPGSVRILCSECERKERHNMQQLNGAWAKHYSKNGKTI
jgi:ribosome-binding protein aMBF1 (putative translation factor)